MTERSKRWKAAALYSVLPAGLEGEAAPVVADWVTF